MTHTYIYYSITLNLTSSKYNIVLFRKLFIQPICNNRKIVCQSVRLKFTRSEHLLVYIVPCAVVVEVYVTNIIVHAGFSNKYFYIKYKYAF